MKSLSIILILLALAGCHGAEVSKRVRAQERSISSIIVDGLEAMKVKMVNGSPKYGVPPLAPLKINHKDFNFQTGNFHADCEVDGVEVFGLNTFNIIFVDVNVFFSRIKFELNFGSLNVTTKYKADVGAGYNMQRNGGAFLALENLNVHGVIKFSTGLVSSNSNLRIKNISVQIVVDNVVSQIENLSKYRIMNRKLNEVVEEFITIAINENTENMEEWINGKVTPACNDFIGDRSLKDLLTLIAGGN